MDQNQQLIEELMEISKITGDAKLSTASGHIHVQPWSMTQSIVRWFHGEKREKTVERLSETYKFATNRLMELLDNQSLNLIIFKNILPNAEFQAYRMKKLELEQLTEALKQSLTGLGHLHRTYKSELNSLEYIRKKVEGMIETATKHLADLTERETKTAVLSRAADVLPKEDDEKANNSYQYTNRSTLPS